MLARDVAAAHDEFMTARGYGKEKRLYAHGQGYDLVERPLIREDETMALAAGMNLAVHPGFETPSDLRGDLRQLSDRQGRTRRMPAQDAEEGVRALIAI